MASFNNVLVPDFSTNENINNLIYSHLKDDSIKLKIKVSAHIPKYCLSPSRARSIRIVLNQQSKKIITLYFKNFIST